MRVVKLILGIVGVYISLQMYDMNNVKYEWTNEADSVFSNEDSRVEVPYVGPSLDMSYVTSTIKSLVYMKSIVYKTWK